MQTIGLISYCVLWLIVGFLAFLLLGALRALGLLQWRMEQLEATTPRRVAREGLKRGTPAPDFTLPGVAGPEVSLHDFAGRRRLLVFTQTGCSACHEIVPQLNRLQNKGTVQVLLVITGEPHECRAWAETTGAQFPVLVQQEMTLSRSYQVFATPFAFVIDERDVIIAKGIVNNAQHLGYVLAGASNEPRGEGSGPEASAPENRAGNERQVRAPASAGGF
jgi:methylamine dehydrogenase accessory protein MauD